MATTLKPHDELVGWKQENKFGLQAKLVFGSVSEQLSKSTDASGDGI